jgi:hypothetical protein
MQNLLKPAYPEDADITIQSANTGAQVTLGGEARVQVPAPPLPWKKWLLWTILVSAVLTLAMMAYRLLKQMGPQKKQ